MVVHAAGAVGPVVLLPLSAGDQDLDPASRGLAQDHSLRGLVTATRPSSSHSSVLPPGHACSTPSALEDPKAQGQSGGVYPCALEQREFKQSMVSYLAFFLQ